MSIDEDIAPRPSFTRPVGTAGRDARPSRGRLLGTATVLMGLLAGVFYAYACSVMPGLANADDRAMIEAMQEIDKAIENPVFFASFLGAPVLTLAALIRERRDRSIARWILAALVLYGVSFVATAGFNIPLNEDLKRAGDASRIADPGQVRDEFMDAWVAWNIVRAVVCTAALGCLAYALILVGRRQGRSH